LCEHTRLIDRHDTAGRTVYDWRHYLAVLQRKHAALSVKGRRILPSRGRSNFPTRLRCVVVV
jgi:hypothetical protein